MKLRSPLIATTVLATSLFIAVGPAQAAEIEGTHDTSFNGAGSVLSAFGPGVDAAYAVAVQPDGKIVVAGTTDVRGNSDFAVFRHTPEGGYDEAFYEVTEMGGSDAVNAVALQPDGKVVVAGYTYAGNNADFALARYTSEGEQDLSFGGDGEVITSLGSSLDSAESLVVQPDGKILVAGWTTTTIHEEEPPVEQFALARYLTDGSLDASFGVSGIVRTSVGTGPSRAHAVALQPDGRIVAVGQASQFELGPDQDLAVARYTSAGLLDSTFGGGGRVLTRMGEEHDVAHAVAIQPDGKIVVAGSSRGWNPNTGAESTYRIAVARYTKQGALDTTFGRVVTEGDISGTNATSIGSDSWARAVAIQPDGKIVVAGSAVQAEHDLAIARYGRDGMLDTTFNDIGWTTENLEDSTDDMAEAVAIQPDGKIVVAGTSSYASGDIAVARFHGDAIVPFGARMAGVPRYSTSLSRTYGWLASDDNTGVQNFDVAAKSATATGGAYGSYSTVKSATSLPYATISRTRGTTTCFKVRARDFAGNVGAYSPAACVAFPMDERSLTDAGSWSEVSSSSYYLGTAMRSTTAGATLKTPAPVSYRHLAVVVTTCADCGTLKVYRGGTLLKTVNLASSTTSRKKVIEVARSGSTVSGTITLKQASSGKKVIVEGLAVSLA